MRLEKEIKTHRSEVHWVCEEAGAGKDRAEGEVSNQEGWEATWLEPR